MTLPWYGFAGVGLEHFLEGPKRKRTLVRRLNVLQNRGVESRSNRKPTGGQGLKQGKGWAGQKLDKGGGGRAAAGRGEGARSRGWYRRVVGL